MQVEVYPFHQALDGADLRGAALVAVDVIRATTSLAVALASGAGAVHPAASEEEAWAIAGRLPAAVLAGERGAIRIPGFDLGNSPAEFRRFSEPGWRGRPLVLCTTNGSRALRAGATAEILIAAALVNASAVARHLAGEGPRRVVLACAGTVGRFSLEDVLCAGRIAGCLRDAGAALDDLGLVAADLADRCRGREVEWLARGEAAANLRRAGLEADLVDCAACDSLQVVPIRLPGEPLEAPLRALGTR